MGGLGTPVRSEIGRYQCRTVSSLCRMCSPLLLRRIARNPGPIASRRTAFRRRESAVTMMLVAIACQRHPDVAVEQTKTHVPCPIALRLPRSLLLAPSSVIERLRLLRLHRDLRAILIPLNQIPKLGNRPSSSCSSFDLLALRREKSRSSWQLFCFRLCDGENSRGRRRARERGRLLNFGI